MENKLVYAARLRRSTCPRSQGRRQWHPRKPAAHRGFECPPATGNDGSSPPTTVMSSKQLPEVRNDSLMSASEFL